MSRKRKNLVVTESFNRKLEIMKEISGAPSEAEAFRMAVDLYIRLMKRQISGGRIEVVESSGSRSEEAPLYDYFYLGDACPETLRQLGLSKEAVDQARHNLSLA